ncbi:MAG TPA: hypothetical protein VIV60_24230 [Polyangiaceae bacterium]
MADPNREMLCKVAEALRALDIAIVYVGGATIALYLDSYAASQVRVTIDVDCVVPISSLTEYQTLEAHLRKLGFRHCHDENAPICRWNYDDLTIDIMPFDDSVLGFANHFSRQGFAHAQEHELAPGLVIRTLTPSYYFASKVEAYESRGAKAPYESKDLEDVIALLDGAPDLETEIAKATDEVRKYVARWATLFLRNPLARDLVEGHIARGPLFEQRIERVLLRLRRLSSAPP